MTLHLTRNKPGHNCNHGRIGIMFVWKWPFVIIWKRHVACMCGINEILSDIKK
jgi:hypothetical protein